MMPQSTSTDKSQYQTKHDPERLSFARDSPINPGCHQKVYHSTDKTINAKNCPDAQTATSPASFKDGDSLLKYSDAILPTESGQKIFLTAEYLLKHVRRKYQRVFARIDKKSRGYSTLTEENVGGDDVVTDRALPSREAENITKRETISSPSLRLQNEMSGKNNETFYGNMNAKDDADIFYQRSVRSTVSYRDAHFTTGGENLTVEGDSHTSGRDKCDCRSRKTARETNDGHDFQCCENHLNDESENPQHSSDETDSSESDEELSNGGTGCHDNVSEVSPQDEKDWAYPCAAERTWGPNVPVIPAWEAESVDGGGTKLKNSKESTVVPMDAPAPGCENHAVISERKDELIRQKLKDYCQLLLTRLTMDIKRILKKIDMASLQSPRTQCCCCAIGVFAAMFGIFMLSAGICIVLNVTFMEVDTSGLPPELHNESGKKVVGIILICVAIGALGLSATVSVVYFWLCNRKERPASTSAATGANGVASQQQLQDGKTNPNMPGAHRMPGYGASPSERPMSRDSNRSASQTSLKSVKSTNRRQSPPSGIDGAQFSRSVVPGVSGRPASRGHSGVPRSYKKPRSRGFRQGRYRSGLDPHPEEDAEFAKESGMHLRPVETPSSETDAKETLAEGYEGAASASAVSKQIPPVIVVDHSQQESYTPMSTMDSLDEYRETQFMDSPLREVMGYHDHPEGGTAPRRLFEPDLNDSSTLDSASFLNEINNTSQDFNFGSSQKSYLSESMENPDMEPPPSLPYNIDVVSDDKHHGDAAELPPLSPSSPPQQKPHLPNILMVKPPEGVGLGTPLSSSSTLDQLDAFDDENDALPDLPSNFTSQEATARTQTELTDPDSRCESSASFNSAFSYDGGDPDISDMDKLHQKMQQLLKSDDESPSN